MQDWRAQLDELATHDQPGWFNNGYGGDWGVPILPECVAAARSLGERLVAACPANPPHPDGDPQDGSVCLNWWRGHDSLTIYAEPDGTCMVYALGEHPDGNPAGRVTIDREDIGQDEAVALASAWLTAARPTPGA